MRYMRIPSRPALVRSSSSCKQFFLALTCADIAFEAWLILQEVTTPRSKLTQLSKLVGNTTMSCSQGRQLILSLQHQQLWDFPPRQPEKKRPVLLPAYLCNSGHFGSSWECTVVLAQLYRNWHPLSLHCSSPLASVVTQQKHNYQNTQPRLFLFFLISLNSIIWRKFTSGKWRIPWVCETVLSCNRWTTILKAISKLDYHHDWIQLQHFFFVALLPPCSRWTVVDFSFASSFEVIFWIICLINLWNISSTFVFVLAEVSKYSKPAK